MPVRRFLQKTPLDEKFFTVMISYTKREFKLKMTVMAWNNWSLTEERDNIFSEEQNVTNMPAMLIKKRTKEGCVTTKSSACSSRLPE